MAPSSGSSSVTFSSWLWLLQLYAEETIAPQPPVYGRPSWNTWTAWTESSSVPFRIDTAHFPCTVTVELLSSYTTTCPPVRLISASYTEIPSCAYASGLPMTREPLPSIASEPEKSVIPCPTPPIRLFPSSVSRTLLK